MLPKPKLELDKLLAPEVAGLFKPEELFSNATNLEPTADIIKPQCIRLTHRFECNQCARPFASFKGLQQHIGKKHNSRKKYSKCPECEKKFRDKYAVRFHRRQVHEKVTRVACTECGLELYNKYALKTHQLTHH